MRLKELLWRQVNNRQKTVTCLSTTYPQCECVHSVSKFKMSLSSYAQINIWYSEILIYKVTLARLSRTVWYQVIKHSSKMFKLVSVNTNQNLQNGILKKKGSHEYFFKLILFVALFALAFAAPEPEPLLAYAAAPVVAAAPAVVAAAPAGAIYTAKYYSAPAVVVGWIRNVSFTTFLSWGFSLMYLLLSCLLSLLFPFFRLPLLQDLFLSFFACLWCDDVAIERNKWNTIKNYFFIHISRLCVGPPPLKSHYFILG